MKVKNISKSPMKIGTLDGKEYLIEGGKSIEIVEIIHPYFLKMQDLKVVEDVEKVKETKKTKEGEE